VEIVLQIIGYNVSVSNNNFCQLAKTGRLNYFVLQIIEVVKGSDMSWYLHQWAYCSARFSKEAGLHQVR
jgi:hypothetical protein